VALGENSAEAWPAAEKLRSNSRSRHLTLGSIWTGGNSPVMASSTLLTLIVIPAIYAVVKGIRLRAAGPADSFARAVTRDWSIERG
jgi:hypothetical protein